MREYNWKVKAYATKECVKEDGQRKGLCVIGKS